MAIGLVTTAAARPAGDVGDRLTDRGQRRLRAAVIGLARPRRCGMAGGHDRQCVGECSGRILGPDVGERHVESERLGAVTEVVAIAEQIECGKLQFIAAQPRLDRDVGPDTRRFA